MKLQIELTKEEAYEIKALSIEHALTPEKILQAFAADVTGSLRSGGSDERDYAEAWIKRRFLPRVEPLTDDHLVQMEILQNRAFRERQIQQRKWQAEYLAKQKGTI